jgi:colicin import membrane protein
MRYEVPRPPGRLESAALAVLVHSLLVILLVFGVRWQSQPPAIVQAELWSALPQTAVSQPAPALRPQPAPLPTPAPRPQPMVARQTPKVEEPAPVKPDIAIKVEKPKKKEPPKKEPPPKEPLPKEVPKPPIKAEPTKPAPKVEIKPSKAPPSAEARPPSQPSQSIADLIAQAGAPSKGPATPAGRSRAGDAGYIALIRTKIRPNIRFPLPPDLVGNPEAHFVIEQLPTGEIVSVNKTKSSGLPAFDAAVERAILASSPLPKRQDGTVDRKLNLVFTPLDHP